MNVLTFVIKKLFIHGKDVSMEQQQKVLDNSLKLKPIPQPSLDVESDKNKTVEEAPEPGEEGAP